MIRAIMALGALSILVSCGGGRANGVIGQACQASDRSAASAQLCSCIQRAANATLRGSDQSKAAEFFADPQLAHDTKMSTTAANDAFWVRYTNFTETAQRSCRA